MAMWVMFLQQARKQAMVIFRLARQRQTDCLLQALHAKMPLVDSVVQEHIAWALAQNHTPSAS